jgi:type IV secretion system protein VirB9
MTGKYLGALLASLILAAPATAQFAEGSQVAPNIRYVEYNPDAVIRLTGHTGYQMMLEFEPGEKIETVGIGDSSGWQVTPNGAGTIMFLKPVGTPPTTNLSIITNQRRYNLELVAKSGLRVPQSQIVYAVRFRYPQKPVAADIAATPPPLIATPPEYWNRAYSYDGAKGNVPEQVFDDGKATYFRRSVCACHFQHHPRRWREHRQLCHARSVYRGRAGRAAVRPAPRQGSHYHI